MLASLPNKEKDAIDGEADEHHFDILFHLRTASLLRNRIDTLLGCRSHGLVEVISSDKIGSQDHVGRQRNCEEKSAGGGGKSTEKGATDSAEG